MKNKEKSKSNLIHKVLNFKTLDYDTYKRGENYEKFIFPEYNLSLIFYNFKGSIFNGNYSFLTLYINSRIIYQDEK